MSAESGKDGKILIASTPIADILSWEFNKEAVTSRFASSSTAGYKKTLAGAKQGDGTITFTWDSAAASPIVEGTSVTLKLYTNGTEFFTVPAIIRNFRLRVNIDTGEYIAASATFETDGAWTEPTLT